MFQSRFILCDPFVLPVSVLDLAPIVQGSDPRTALANLRSLAKHAESVGYRRYWLAEHHNMGGIASSATAVLIGHVADVTSTIRVGSGGIMLPNHAPLVIAEQFGTLATLYPDRIDLGIGRAPGTDPVTTSALRRSLRSDIDEFPRDVVELQRYLGPRRPGQKVRAVPGEGTNIPIWILGSSLYGAQLAALLGLPYAFASHFAPAQMVEAIKVYRERFAPSPQLEKPYVMLGLNVCAAESDEEAHYLRSSGLQSYLRMRAGQPSRLPPPVRDFEGNLDPTSQKLIQMSQVTTVVGSRESVREGIQRFVDQTGADELIFVCQIYEHEKRVESYRIAAEAARTVCPDVSVEADPASQSTADGSAKATEN